jgi:hypothetical protein
MAKRLDELFETYEKRKQSEERSAEEKAARVKRERDEAVAVLRERVIPTLRRLAEDIRGKGHEANVTDALDGELPHVIFDFTPRKRSDKSPVPTISRLRISWNTGEFIETAQEIALSSSRGIAERHRLRDATPEWTNVQAFFLVEAALKNH